MSKKKIKFNFDNSKKVSEMAKDFFSQPHIKEYLLSLDSSSERETSKEKEQYYYIELVDVINKEDIKRMENLTYSINTNVDIKDHKIILKDLTSLKYMYRETLREFIKFTEVNHTRSLEQYKKESTFYSEQINNTTKLAYL